MEDWDRERFTAARSDLQRSKSHWGDSDRGSGRWKIIVSDNFIPNPTKYHCGPGRRIAQRVAAESWFETPA